MSLKPCASGTCDNFEVDVSSACNWHTSLRQLVCYCSFSGKVLGKGFFLKVKDEKLLPALHFYISLGWFLYTIGQRARLAGLRDAWFVVDKDVSTGDVFVVS